MKVVSVAICAKVGPVVRRAGCLLSLLLTILTACSSSGQKVPDGGNPGSGGAGGPMGSTGTGATGVGGRGGGGAGGILGASCRTQVDCGSGFGCFDSVCRVDSPCVKDSDCPSGITCSISWQACGALGSSCSSDLQCASNLVCSAGVCAGGFQSPCDNSAECSVPGTICYATGAVAGRCLGAQDSPCVSTDQCGGLHCINGVCAPGPGDPCSGTVVDTCIVSGRYVCDRTNNYCTTTVQPIAGGSCVAGGSNCVGDLGAAQCSNGTCGAVGSACHDNATCMWGLACSKGTCVNEAPLGQPCAAVGCAPGLVCVSPSTSAPLCLGGSGASCTAGDQCASGNCAAGLCLESADGGGGTGAAGSSGGGSSTGAAGAGGSAGASGGGGTGRACTGVIRNGLCCTGTCSVQGNTCVYDTDCNIGSCSENSSMTRSSKSNPCSGTCVPAKCVFSGGCA